MTSEAVVLEIIETARQTLVYLLPVIGTIAGINYVVSWIMYLTVEQGNRVFGRR